MEENQKDLFGELPEQDTPVQAVSEPCEEVPIADTAPQQDIDTSAEQAEPMEEADAQDEDEAPQAPAWDFGGATCQKQKKGTGKIAFFSVFGSVLLICLALLVLLLFVGENGIQIIRTLYNERVVYVREDDGTSGMLTHQEAADVVRKSTVTVSVKDLEGRSSIGTGFVYDDNGHICTNYHVVEGAALVQVILPDGNAYDAQVVGYNAPADLAVLRVQASGLVPAVIGSSASLLVGDEVLAVGTPANVTLAGTATFGRVSYTSRLLPLDDDGDGVYEKKITVIQADTSINAGNSGGPVADMYGRVVGVAARKIEVYNDRVYEGVGFAIPIDGAKIILDAIIRDGAFTGDNPIVEGRSLLGVTGHGGMKGYWYYVDPITGLVQQSAVEAEGYHYMPANGVYAMEVTGANAKNKVLAGDIILSLNGRSVYDTKELITAANCYPCGTTVSLCVWRNGAEITVQVILAEG